MLHFRFVSLRFLAPHEMRTCLNYSKEFQSRERTGKIHIHLEAATRGRKGIEQNRQRRYLLPRSYASSVRTPPTANSEQRRDPLAKKPNKLCDPYGQNGKPLGYSQVALLLKTLEKGWAVSSFCYPNKNSEQLVATSSTPKSIYKEYHHESFTQGSKFITCLASLCHVHNHFATFLLERKLGERASSSWIYVTTVTCHTPTLEGLSYNDFHLAMMIDVESEKMKHLLKSNTA